MALPFPYPSKPLPAASEGTRHVHMLHGNVGTYLPCPDSTYPGLHMRGVGMALGVLEK
jgi:hypothetical protein